MSDERRLDGEGHDLACVDCGAVCRPLPMLVYGMDRCPECHIEQARCEAFRAFGTLETVEAMLVGPTHEPTPPREADVHQEGSA